MIVVPHTDAFTCIQQCQKYGFSHMSAISHKYIISASIGKVFNSLFLLYIQVHGGGYLFTPKFSNSIHVCLTYPIIQFSFEFAKTKLATKERLEEDDKVEKLCDEFWEWRMKESPEFASYCGDQRYCDLLDDIDTEAFKGFEVC